MYRVFSCLTTEHDLRLVVLAAVVCLLATFTGLTLFWRARARAGRARLAWAIGAGFATGCGVWTTHFIAMLAYEPAVPIAYDIILTLTSLVVAIGVAAFGFVLALENGRPFIALAGGSVVGLGVALMHFIGMSALEMPGHIHWSLTLVHVSVAFSVLFSTLSIATVRRSSGAISLIKGGVLLTVGIVALHFTGMGAVDIVPDPAREFSGLSVSPGSLAITLASLAGAILGISLIAAFADRTAKNQLLLVNDALDHMSQGLAMFDANKRLILWNKRYEQIYSLENRIKRSMTLAELLEQRVAVGSLKEDPHEYARRAEAATDAGREFKHLFTLPNGRIVAGSNRARPNGGWVSTHEDITERENIERERASMEKEKARRQAIDSAIAEFREAAASLLANVNRSMGAMQTTAMGLLSDAQKTSQRVSESVMIFDEATANVNAVASAAHQLSTSVTDVSTQLDQTTQIAAAAAKEAKTTDSEIAELATGTGRIGEVVSLIKRIAAQTNLLALNATIEASRAGDAGRGFSVVAQEVKSLSIQTAKATEDIASLVAHAQSSTSVAIGTIQRITVQMREIDKSAAAAANAVGQQSISTGEISQNISEAAKGSLVVSSVLNEVSGATQNAQKSAEIVLNATETVQRTVTELKEQVEEFLKSVAA